MHDDFQKHNTQINDGLDHKFDSGFDSDICDLSGNDPLTFTKKIKAYIALFLGLIILILILIFDEKLEV